MSKNQKDEILGRGILSLFVVTGIVFSGITFFVIDDGIQKVFSENFDISEAYHQLDLSSDTQVGYQEGAIGVLTGNRVDRKSYVEQAINMALIYIVNKDL